MTVLFENEKILAIYKPSGMPSHSLNEDDPSVERQVNQMRPESPCFLLHRLDTGTSGVLLFAKSKVVFEQMREKFKTRSIRKFYRAFSEKTPVRHEQFRRLHFPLEITTSLAHHPKSKKRMIVLPEDKHRDYRGKPLPAHTRLLGARENTFCEKPVIEFEVEIITGVMHQIRVHLQSLGFALIGDAIYRTRDLAVQETPSTRLGLHAERIEFELDSVSYKIEAPLTT